MGFRKSSSSVKSSLATATVLQQSVEKSLALEPENSKLRYHVSVLSQRLHQVIAELKVRSKITAAFCPFCGDNHNQVDCELWMEKVVEEERRLEKVEFAGSMDVVPLEIEEEVAEVAEKKIVMRLPVAVAESVAEAEVAEDVAMVEVARKGKEVAVVAEEAEEGVGSREEDWTLVQRRVRESGLEKRRRLLEEEREVVRKRMNVWRPAKVEVPNEPLGPRSMRVRFGSDSGYRSPGPSRLGESVVVTEEVEKVGEGVVLKMLVGILTGPRSYTSVAMGSEKRFGFRGLRSVPEGRKLNGPNSDRRLVVYRKRNERDGRENAIESLQKENSNLRAMNTKILERVKEMKTEMDMGYEERVKEYRKECMERVMDRIDKEVEESLKSEREKVERKFGELNAGF
ncbi:hypothetical protein HOY80DRAFT_1096320 [Tuber brumale]|nr:hypothetical protein HOY80DRAFT_1096320 [Tuber brumale]